MNLPNRLTIMRMVMIPVIILVYLFPYSAIGLTPVIFHIGGVELSSINLIVLALYVLAAVTDALDGHIARSQNLITTFGKFADPIADKLLTTSMFLLFASRGIIPVVPVIIMGKIKTVLQMVTVAVVLLNNLPFEMFGLPVSEILLWFAAFVSMVSGIQYFNQTKEDILESK